RALTPSTRAQAQAVAVDMAVRDDRYVTRRFRKLDPTTAEWTLASWDELQWYAPFQRSIDLTPSGSRLLVNTGVACGGGFVQFCLGRADAATASSGFADA